MGKPYSIKRITWLVLMAAYIMPQCSSQPEKKTEWPSKIQVILDNTSELKYGRGSRLPLYLWPGIDPGVMDDRTAEKLINEMDKRGIGIVCSWSVDDTAKVLSQCLPVARAQKKLGLMINISATDLMDSFFTGDPSTAHIDSEGKPFFDTSFGKHKMGCPFTLDGRKEEIKKRFEYFINRYRKEGLDVDFIFTDWEIDGPLEVNGAFEASQKCERCRKYLGKDFTFTEFQAKMREMRAYLQSYTYSGPILDAFPGAFVGNYAVYPNDGYRYWYDYFEYYVDGQPCKVEQNARYRKWYNDFPLTGFTFAMPVVYPWGRIYDWYDFEDSDYRWVYNMLLNAGNAGKSTPREIPVISFVHWHTIAEGPGSDTAAKQLSMNNYQEMLWHMLLRGTNAFFLWCMESENPDEVRLLHEVYAEAQKYGQFLDKGIPVNFGLPDHPGTVVSGLALGDSLLVRRTDFDDNHEPVSLMAGTRQVTVQSSPGKCVIISLY